MIRPRRSPARQHLFHRIAVAMLSLLPAATPAMSAIDLCGAAARRASAETGVPEQLLKAISLTESGRKSDGQFIAWPWTINAGGDGRWLASRNEAKLHIAGLRQQGVTNFDIGCFQLNHRWHGTAFHSAAAMLTPEDNARYAALYLSELHGELGSWHAAARAYHSRSPDKADIYEQKLAGNLRHVGSSFAALDGGGTSTTTVAQAETVSPPGAPSPARQHAAGRAENRYPFLQVARSSGRLGSLVPLGGASGPGLFGPRN